MANKNIIKHITLYRTTSYGNSQAIADGIKKHGADGIELQFTEIPPAISVADSVLIGSLATEKYDLFDLACSENDQRSESIRFFNELLEFASRCSVSANGDQDKPIVAIRAHINKSPDDLEVQSYEQAMNNLYFSLEELIQTAEKLGVTLAIENPAAGILQSPLELRNMLNELNNPFIGICFNPLNAERLGNVKDWFEILGRHILAVRTTITDSSCQATEGRWQDILSEFQMNPIGSIVIMTPAS